MLFDRLTEVNWRSRRTLLALLVGAVIMTGAAAIIGIFAGGGDFLWRSIGTVWSFVLVVATVAYVNRLAMNGEAILFVKLHLVVALVSVISFVAVLWLVPTPDLFERLAFACLATIVGNVVIAFVLLRQEDAGKIRLAVRTAVVSTAALVILTDVRALGNIEGSATLDQLTAVLVILAASASVITVLLHKMEARSSASKTAATEPRPPEENPTPIVRAPTRPRATSSISARRPAARKKPSPKSSGSGRS